MGCRSVTCITELLLSSTGNEGKCLEKSDHIYLILSEGSLPQFFHETCGDCSTGFVIIQALLRQKSIPSKVLRGHKVRVDW